MSNKRCLLHRIDIDDFKSYLIYKGLYLDEPKSFYEVIRAVNLRTKKVAFIAYDRNSGDHFTVESKYQGLVRDYIKFKRGEK